MHPLYLDPKKFKGFALVNRGTKELAIIVKNESSFDKEFIMKPKDVYYALVADVIEVMPLNWAKKSYFRYLEDIPKLENYRGKLRSI